MTKLLCALLAVAAATTPLRAQAADPRAGSDQPIVRARPWDPETVRLAETLPLQDQGRIKPLSTYAGFKLLQLNGRRTLDFKVDPNGIVVQDPERTDLHDVSLTPTEWLLDVLFFPEQARDYPCILVQTWEAIDAIGIDRLKHSKRDRYCYAELQPGLKKLIDLAQQIQKQKPEAKDLDATETQIVQLAHKLSELRQLTHYLDFAREDFDVAKQGNLATLFGEAPTEQVRFSAILRKLPLLLTAYEKTDGQGPERQALGNLLGMAQQDAMIAATLALLPPPGSTKEHAEWLTPGDLFTLRERGSDAAERQIALVVDLENAARAVDDPAALRTNLSAFHSAAKQMATERGEYGKIGLEVSFYKGDFFYRALVLYILCFILVASSWLVPATSALHKWLPLAVLLPFALHVTGVVLRCVLRSRPPVSTLYETILFISGVAVMVALVIEFLNRRRVAVALATLLGAAGLFLATRFEAKEAYDSGVDTMPQLQAVLDTNFWLSTHVTSVTIGYSAGLLAGFIAYLYVLGKLFGLKKDSPDFYRTIARMTYGVLCFGLLFSVVGTILGGVWANDSWGRFWGWDPKENGALMICLWELTILHGRMGGYLRDLGVCMAAIFGNAIVAFSWFHVNLLGVGLHAYGFTNGILGKLYVFYGVEALLLLGGLFLWIDARNATERKATPFAGAREGLRS